MVHGTFPPLKSQARGPAARAALVAAPWLALLVLWYAIRASGLINPSLVPAPHAVLSKFLELLQEPPQEGQTEDARFRVRLAFFRYLPPETRVRLLERRRNGLEDRLAEIKKHLRDPGNADDYQRALMDHARAATEADIAWLTELIRAERQRYEITAPVGERRRASATLRRKEHTA